MLAGNDRCVRCNEFLWGHISVFSGHKLFIFDVRSHAAPSIDMVVLIAPGAAIHYCMFTSQSGDVLHFGDMNCNAFQLIWDKLLPTSDVFSVLSHGFPFKSRSLQKQHRFFSVALCSFPDLRPKANGIPRPPPLGTI